MPALAAGLNARSNRTVELYRDTVKPLRERLADLRLKDRASASATSSRAGHAGKRDVCPQPGQLVIDAADGERIYLAWA